MAIKKFTTDAVWNTGIEGYSSYGYRMLKYSGSLGGGTLQIFSLSRQVDAETSATIETPVSDAKLNATKTDSNGDPIKQMAFATSGPIVVKLTGATSPDCKVIVE